jgi:phosphatidate phosphatase APP1
VQKRDQISTIMKNLPRRRFILFGDSGEKDPEVLAEMRSLFGPRVSEIHIRDVVGERSKPGSRRLEGMQVIEADTISPTSHS